MIERWNEYAEGLAQRLRAWNAGLCDNMVKIEAGPYLGGDEWQIDLSVASEPGRRRDESVQVSFRGIIAVVRVGTCSGCYGSDERMVSRLRAARAKVAIYTLATLAEADVARWNAEQS